MPPEKSNHPKIPSRKRWSCLPPCFVGSPVSDSDCSDSPGPSAGSKPKLSWFRYRKKKKKKTAAALDGAVRPDIKASTPSKKPSEGRTGKSGGHAQQPQRHADSERPRLPRMSKKYSARGGDSPPPSKVCTVRARSMVDHPGSPVHIHPAASQKIPVRTGSIKPTAGIWVMMMTLAVMVFLGRAPALLCLCCCMYLVPLLSAAKKDGSSGGDGVAPGKIDMDSEEHKKRVILEGLLERNDRKSSSFLVAMASAGGTR